MHYSFMYGTDSQVKLHTALSFVVHWAAGANVAADMSKRKQDVYQKKFTYRQHTVSFI